MIKSFKNIPDKRCKDLDSPAYVLSITYYLGTFKSKVNGNFLASNFRFHVRLIHNFPVGKSTMYVVKKISPYLKQFNVVTKL